MTEEVVTNMISDEGLHPGLANEEDSDKANRCFIRIRSKNDGIFEQEEDEDEELQKILIPEIEMGGSPPPSKGKQQCVRENVGIDDIGVPDDKSVTTVDLELETGRQRNRDRIPLYCLNPDDYGHDLEKQRQIKKAIITWKFHKRKYWTIAQLTEENKKLRDHNDLLKMKVRQLSGCGCVKNEVADLSVLDIKIPRALPVPEPYLSGKIAIGKEQAPSQKQSKAQSVPAPSSTASKVTLPVPMEVVKPVINISSTRLRKNLLSPALTSTMTNENTKSTTATLPSRIVWSRKGNAINAARVVSKLLSLSSNRTTPPLILPRVRNSMPAVKPQMTASQFEVRTRKRTPAAAVIINPFSLFQTVPFQPFYVQTPMNKHPMTPPDQVLVELKHPPPVGDKEQEDPKLRGLNQQPTTMTSQVFDLDREVLKRRARKQQLGRRQK